jgi:hypothetical protein
MIEAAAAGAARVGTLIAAKRQLKQKFWLWAAGAAHVGGKRLKVRFDAAFGRFVFEGGRAQISKICP